VTHTLAPASPFPRLSPPAPRPQQTFSAFALVASSLELALLSPAFGAGLAWHLGYLYIPIHICINFIAALSAHLTTCFHSWQTFSAFALVASSLELALLSLAFGAGVAHI
jgi:hypothetical protein